ncbi:MAG: hypothetical protein R2726_05520 [Acidimicrobiales bacterium]
MSDSSQGPGWWQASDGKWYPPEQAPGYQAAGAGGAGGPVQFDLGAALTYGWNKFVQYIGQVIIIVLIVVGVNILFNIFRGIVNSQVSGLVGLFISLGMSILGFVISLVLQIGLIRMALMITNGETPDPGTVFKFDNLGPYAIASILVGILTFLGLFVFCIGALIVAFFTVFYGFYCIDQNQGPTDCIMSSFNLVKDNIGQVLLFVIIVVVLNFITCGLAYGVTQIATGYAYRTLNGQPVAP